MVSSFLRKKRQSSHSHTRADGTPTSSITPGMRHSLSLPDLTTPLIDASSWEEVPPFAFDQKAPAGPAGIVGGRGRKPSLIGASAGDIQFHRPFTPKMISPTSVTQPGGTALDFGSDTTRRGDFRTSTSRWSKHGPPTANHEQNQNQYQSDPRLLHRHKGRESVLSALSKRKTRKKGLVGRVNFVVAGGKGAGKTSFIDLFISSLTSDQGDNEFSQAPKPSPSSTFPSPTTRPTAHTVLSTLSDRLQVRLIDTPGLELDPADQVRAKERERGVLGLLRIVEERFEETLREERKVRRRVGAEDGLVHLVIYLIDARRVLRPPAERQDLEVDWSCVGLFEDEPLSAEHPIKGDEDETRLSVDSAAAAGGGGGGGGGDGPKLSSIEIDIIRRLSKRANVLPVLAHADALTTTELFSVREAVRRDLSALALSASASASPGAGAGAGAGGHPDADEEGEVAGALLLFDLDSDEDDGEKTDAINEEEEEEEPDKPESPIQAEQDTIAPSLSPTSSTSTSNKNKNDAARRNAPSVNRPYAIFCPSPHSFPRDHQNRHIPVADADARSGMGMGMGTSRTYPWGTASVLHPLHSDFLLVRRKVLVERLEALKKRTREVLYEQYRTERLMAKRG